MNAFIVIALIMPIAQAPKPKAADPAPFGITADSEYYWPTHLVLASPDVQKELQLTKEQLGHIEKIQAELKRVGETIGGLKPAQAKSYTTKMTKWAEQSLAGALTTDQQTRHRQILWQVLEFNGGIRGQAANDVFAKEVGLTADQLKKAKKIEADYYSAWQKLVRANPLVVNATVPGEEELAKKAEEAALKLLTAEQKKKWNAALGEPFKGEIVQFTIPGLRPVTFKAPAEKS
jgi:hypothetical protein